MGFILSVLSTPYLLIPILLALIYFKLNQSNKWYSKFNIKPISHDLANNKHRKYGKWVPESYIYPKPEPYPEWDINETKPIPYRAFKYKYNVTMGIRNMPKEDWIQLDNEWLKYHNLKKKRLESDLELLGTLPEAKLASIELLYELREFLPERYPKLFLKTEKGIKILPTGEEYDYTNLEKDPMYYITLLLQDDIAIMIEDDKGEYFLKSAAILLAGFWRFKDKVNKSLSEIHFSGNVPKYKTNLKSGMEKFFQRLQVDNPVVRNNYFLQTDNNLDWSNSIGDEKVENVGWYTAPIATDINEIWYRSERQSLRRLPITGGVVFTIRTYFLPLTELCKEPFIPLRLLEGIESWDDDVKEYKGYDVFKGVVIPYLQEQAELQKAQGYTKEADNFQYPFNP